MKSYLPPKNNILNWFHLIANVFHISVCPASHRWPFVHGTICCRKEVEYGAIHCNNGKYIQCPSYPTRCASGNYLAFATSMSVFICFWYTNYILEPKPGFYTQYLPKKMWLVILIRTVFFFENYLR